MSTTTILVLVYFAVFVGLTLYFAVRESPLWKSTLIVLVLSLFGLALWFPGPNGYTPDQRLVPGLDLAGGTSLVYDVKVPAGRDPKTVIEDTISILSKRVDPSGTRNLVWREVAGNRLEVQMPLPDKETTRLRKVYQEARSAALAGNISEQDLDVKLRATGPSREADLLALAGNSPTKTQLLKTVYAAYNALSKAAADNDAAQAAYDQASKAADDMPASASEDELAKAKAHAEDLRKDLESKALDFLDAKDQYDAARKTLLQANITEYDLDRIEGLPEPKNPDEPGVENLRREAADALIAASPNRADAINAWYQAYENYESKKGQLDDPEDLIQLLQGSGVLEFRIVPEPTDTGLDVESYREKLSEQGPRSGRDKAYIWCQIDDISEYVGDKDRLKAVEQDPAGFFASGNNPRVVQKYANNYYLLLGNVPSLAMTQDQDWSLRSAQPTVDQNTGQQAVAFELDSKGAIRMSQITGPNIRKMMAILLDGKVISSPVLNSKIAGRGQITGGMDGFDPKELHYLLSTLKAGSLEGELSKRPISQKTIGAKFGQDNIRAGFESARDSLIIVALFMLCYYLFAGLVADFALVANMILILGVMAALRSTFTLPGIAGIVLTIGMAVDANVLIFERIREESERGADLTTSMRLGFEKALSTILDANITTLITCLVLGYTATVEIKGFAVTLGIGILATLFTALFCTRVILELYLKITKAKSLPMLPTLVPFVGKIFRPNINWIKLRYIFFAISATAIILGLLAVFERGQDMLDIEFRSGTKVSFELAEGKTITLPDARARIRAYGEAGDLIQEGKPATPELSKVYETLQPIVASAKARAEAKVENAYQTYLDENDKKPSADQPDAAGPDNNLTIEEKAKIADVPLNYVDFSLFTDAADSGVVTEGPTTVDEKKDVWAHGFGVATLVQDTQAVSAVIKAAFSDVLDTTLPVSFDSISVDNVNHAPVYAIRTAILGDNIGRSSDVRVNVADAVGGVAVVMSDLSPRVTLDDLHGRIERMRNLPAYESLTSRNWRVIGLDAEGTTAEGKTLYRSAVMVSSDDETNYVESPDSFGAAGGLAETEWNVARDACQRDTSLGSVSNFSSQVSGTMQQQAIVAMVLSLLAVIVYIWFRFGSFTYGFAAIIALVHDVTIAMGLVAISGWVYNHTGQIGTALLIEPFKIDLAMVAAFLTIVGYSLNDTIVVFDRIRENRGRLSYATPQVINDSINQTISRTILTSGTTLLAIWMLYVFGGDGVHGFAFAMLVGVVVGTYSSIAIASPVLMFGGSRHVQKDEPAPTAPPIPEK